MQPALKNIRFHREIFENKNQGRSDNNSNFDISFETYFTQLEKFSKEPARTISPYYFLLAIFFQTFLNDIPCLSVDFQLENINQGWARAMFFIIINLPIFIKYWFFTWYFLAGNCKIKIRFSTISFLVFFNKICPQFRGKNKIVALSI